ncbi:glutathione S-transferase family protein [Marinobacter salarius]|jgi:glutathione S-transferase|uniref:Glutathione S-transferase n=1 Tax=Marinobacter salarius TaxID=1420917 RepID=W5YNK8_9GAMM|nr:MULTISPECIES: glutathione S-transferase family protein [Marinobacter]AHI30807.1 glutathione S-transferase [Marinobacter salarius]MBS8233056.1 glutathione S-transferase family protein [Marinobacter salarius]|tara:strand:- start:430 stop:1110 length:681 start_codon:yes stop_codon:yes gene_type:complete
MYTLHIANKNYSSWSLRPWVLMKELGIEFNEQLIVFGDEPTWQAYRRLSPSGKVPCLTDESTTVWDSLAIIEYLAERHEGVWPKDAKARAWARCAAAEMHSGFQSLRDICSMNVGLRIRMNTVSEGLQKDVDRIDSLWSHGLQQFGGPFLAGDRFSAVDAFFAPVVYRVRTYGLDLSEGAAAYVERVLALGSMQQWEAESLAEPWRDTEHENIAFTVGTLLADHRQ